METSSALLVICAGNSPVPGECPTKRPVTRSIDVYFDLRLNKRLSKQSRGWWFETPLHPLWRHRNVKLVLVTNGPHMKLKFGVRWLSLDLIDDRSTLIQVMAWCRWATSHYLGQYWPRSMSPHDFTRSQWIEVFSAKFHRYLSNKYVGKRYSWIFAWKGHCYNAHITLVINPLLTLTCTLFCTHPKRFSVLSFRWLFFVLSYFYGWWRELCPKFLNTRSAVRLWEIMIVYWKYFQSLWDLRRIWQKSSF